MAKYPGTLETNNINEYGIVKADQIQGHRVVDSVDDLTKLTPAQLSTDKSDSNSIGAVWYVKKNDQFYYLGGSMAEGGSSNINNWRRILTFVSNNGNYYIPIQRIFDATATVDINGISTINGYYLGDTSIDNSLLSKAQIIDLMKEQGVGGYLRESDYLKESDISYIINDCVQ